MNKKIIVLTSLFIILFIVYLILGKEYNKIEIKEETKTDNIWNSLIEFPSNDVSNIKLDYFDYCENGDCYYIDLESLKNEKINDKNINVDIKCLNYELVEEEKNYCTKVNVLVDEVINLDLDTVKDYYYDESLVIFKTNDKYIIKQNSTVYGSGILNIYDINGNLLKKIDNSVNSFDIISDGDVEEESYVYNVVINNNKLYYVVSDDVDFVLGLDNFVHIGYINLESNLDFNELYKINAITSLGI